MQIEAILFESGIFHLRTAIYFAILVGLSYFLNKWSEEQDRTGDPAMARRLEGMSGPGLILYGIDSDVRVDRLGDVARAALVFDDFRNDFHDDRSAGGDGLGDHRGQSAGDEQEPFASAVTPGQFNDLGNLLLTFVMLWAYLSFSQFLIIWSGNLRDEIPWYMTRAPSAHGGSWAVFLIMFHFAVPFLLLLQRGT